MTTRRQFVLTAVPATALLLGGARAASAQPAKLEESDPAAAALGYKMDATKVDAKKYTTWKAGNVCSNCQLYSGKANDAMGPCAAFGGKLVSAKGWCSAWTKKA
jgi:high potential iron-sulfur protein